MICVFIQAGMQMYSISKLYTSFALNNKSILTKYCSTHYIILSTLLWVFSILSGRSSIFSPFYSLIFSCQLLSSCSSVVLQMPFIKGICVCMCFHIVIYGLGNIYFWRIIWKKTSKTLTMTSTYRIHSIHCMHSTTENLRCTINRSISITIGTEKSRIPLEVCVGMKSVYFNKL